MFTAPFTDFHSEGTMFCSSVPVIHDPGRWAGRFSSLESGRSLSCLPTSCSSGLMGITGIKGRIGSCQRFPLSRKVRLQNVEPNPAPGNLLNCFLCRINKVFESKRMRAACLRPSEFFLFCEFFAQDFIDVVAMATNRVKNIRYPVEIKCINV
ncbi:hypothetical protein AMECASPLE_003925 [Ameca splendens]|uniref:Uncharacterized protein n=1 Tax=Ameca splendens TaxID=208324 RepID=A0ABV0ZKD4_9TELE